MPKTVFVDGSILVPTFMDTFFGNSAVTGHVHTGTNDDGSAPLIQPATQFNPSVNNIVPDFNLIDGPSVQLLTDISFDGGATFTQTGVAWFLTRVGNCTTMKLDTPSISGTITGGAQRLVMQPAGGGTWDSLFFGSSPYRSALCVVVDAASFDPGFLRYTGTASDIEFFKTTSSTWANGVTAGIEVGTCILFTK